MSGESSSTLELPRIFDNPFEERSPDPGITLPSEVSDSISYTAWTGLSEMVWKGYIPNQKWLMSQAEGYDIGTPETVRRMVEENPTNSRGIIYTVQMRVNQDEVKDFERLLLIGYLLGTDFVTENLSAVPDDHGADQLVGELRRHWAKKHGIARPETVELTRKAIDDYCTTYSLNGAFERFAERLNL